jgi:predicted nucleic acid-binding Zn ribbon protein
MTYRQRKRHNIILCFGASILAITVTTLLILALI